MISDNFIYKNTLEYFITSTRLMKQTITNHFILQPFMTSEMALVPLKDKKKSLAFFTKISKNPRKGLQIPPKYLPVNNYLMVIQKKLWHLLLLWQLL